MKRRYFLVGLGNPGREYAYTRHNAGFMLVDRLATRLGLTWRFEKKFFAEVAEGFVAGKGVILSKPQTYMNNSGESVKAVVQFHRIAIEDVLVAVDDADLALGMLRMRPEGGAGGHHGLESVQAHLGTKAYARVRLGVARPDQGVRDIASHVLGRFSAAESLLWEKVLDRAVTQAEAWVAEGLAVAMNRYNGAVPE